MPPGLLLQREGGGEATRAIARLYTESNNGHNDNDNSNSSSNIYQRERRERREERGEREREREEKERREKLSRDGTVENARNVAAVATSVSSS